MKPPDNSFRLPPDARPGRARLRVADLERSLALYRDVLGFRAKAQAGSSLALATPEGQGSEEVLLLEEDPRVRSRSRRPVTTGLYHVAFLLPSRVDLEQALLRLVEVGYPLRGASDHSVSESLYLDDPDGNGLELYADRPRDRWIVREGQVHMTVDPLDLQAMLRSAKDRGSSWGGIPPATRVGHVHFTVSDLARAEAFYCQHLGFDLTVRWPTLIGVSAGGYHHHLNLNLWAGPGAPRDPPDVAGLVDWELIAPGAGEPLVAHLGRAGLEPVATPDGVRLEDPDGIPVVICG